MGERIGVGARGPAVADEDGLRHEIGRFFREEMLTESPVGEFHEDDDKYRDHEKRPRKEPLGQSHDTRGRAGRTR
ncbi:MAG: hypothetical protein NVS9B3_09850 [Gemmatimonadaceae bacterium]